MRIRLSKDKCVGHARCHAVDSELFGIDDLGYSVLEEQEVKPGFEERARDGVAACPEHALVLEGDG